MAAELYTCVLFVRYRVRTEAEISVRSVEVGAVMSHNNELLPTLTKHRLTYLNACPSAVTFDATLFYLMQVCVHCLSTAKQGNREHALTVDTLRLNPIFRRVCKIAKSDY